MERLTIPDEPIEGGMRRAVVDARAVREEAMNMYWRLKKYEDICPDPGRLREIDALYLDKCREVMALKQEQWIPISERLPEKDGDYLVTMVMPGDIGGNPYTNWICWCSEAQEWTDTDGSAILEQDIVLAWREIPEPYQPKAAP